MTSQLKALPYSHSLEYLLALDIETGSQGQLLDIGIMSADGFNIYPSWIKFFLYLQSISTQQKSIRVIAHNGVNFDYVGLIMDLARNHKRLKINIDTDLSILTAETMVIGFVLKLNNCKVNFVDTTRFFPGLSLEKISTDLLGETKKPIAEKWYSQMENFKAKFSRRYYEYLEQDCFLLFRIYQKIREEINNLFPIGELGWSSGSTALAAFRQSLCQTRGAIIFGLESHQWDAAKASYRGGMTLYIGDGDSNEQDKFYHVNSYDVISMYPSSMLAIPLPISPLKEITKLSKNIPFGIFETDWKQLQGRVPILYTRDDHNNLPEWSGQKTWLTTFDLLFLRTYGQFKIHRGIVFTDQMFLFEKFIQPLWEERKKAKMEGNKALSQAIKILLNSLYGKFGQNPIGSKIGISCDLDYYIDQGEKLNLSLACDLNFYKKFGFYLYSTPDIRNSFSNQIVAALVTSAARIKLGMLLNTYRSIYCDTDSIFTQDKIDDIFLGDDLGYFEIKDLDQPMICCGKKLYLYGDDRKAKGIPNKNIDSSHFAFLANGEPVRIEYKSPTPLKSAIRKEIENPNEFLSRHRTIKRSPSMRELNILHDVESFDPMQTLDFLRNIWLFD